MKNFDANILKILEIEGFPKKIVVPKKLFLLSLPHTSHFDWYYIFVSLSKTYSQGLNKKAQNPQLNGPGLFLLHECKIHLYLHNFFLFRFNNVIYFFYVF